MANNIFYPYLLQPILKEKVWGGRKLERLMGKHLQRGARVGETWEAWEECRIENGPAKGQTLGGLVKQNSAGILGASADTPRFPLLFKYIDAQEDLSIQVHPNDTQAQAIEHQEFGKTEAWYIVQADPGACLFAGFKQDKSPDDVIASVHDNSLVRLVESIPVQAGDVVFVPAGTVHAIGKGIVLAEIQESSDITYRLYDWGREAKDRPLHLEQSRQVMQAQHIPQPKIAPVVLQGHGYVERHLVLCDYFALALLDVQQTTPHMQMDDRFQILSILEGEAQIMYGEGFKESVRIKLGQTVVLPAGLKGYAIAPKGKSCRILKAFVPNLSMLVERFAQAGVDKAAILQLGGSLPEGNALYRLISAPPPVSSPETLP